MTWGCVADDSGKGRGRRPLSEGRHMTNQITTHWGQHADLHTGTLDDCQHPDCNARRTERWDWRAFLGLSGSRSVGMG